MELDGRIVAITGASSGIGAAMARAFVAAGASVVLGARRLELLEELAAELGEEHALPVRLDVADWAANEAFVQQAVDRFGRLDALVANAGFGAKRGFLESTPEHWRDMILTNVLGCALSIRAALPALKASSGDVVVTSSVAGRRVLEGSVYSATKHAATALAEALRLEVARDGVRVTSLEPGMVDTPFFDDGVPDWALREEDIARGAVYALAQPRHVTVSTLTIRPSAQVV